ncbi:hypothetical protein ACR96G_25205, partial [Klebsiella pneumoniae]
STSKTPSYTKSVSWHHYRHVERKNVKGSYMHTSEYLEERRLMLQWWADYIDANKNGSITPYDFARVHGK